MLAYVIGGAIGLIAGYTRTFVDPLLMRIDGRAARLPAAALPARPRDRASARGAAILIVGVAAIHVPGIARIVRAATLETSVRGYVEAAVARGETTCSILLREILPNITCTVDRRRRRRASRSRSCSSRASTSSASACSRRRRTGR